MPFSDPNTDYNESVTMPDQEMLDALYAVIAPAIESVLAEQTSNDIVLNIHTEITMRACLDLATDYPDELYLPNARIPE